MKTQKKLLITTGPQGSGNHIFARLFSMHPEVKGWEELKEHYWVRHLRESWAEYWWYPQLLKPEIFDNGQYFVTNVSYPYGFDGYLIKPKILEVAEIVKKLDIDVKIAIIARDDTINITQQERIRKQPTLDMARNYFRDVLMPSDIPVHFLSLETFFCYKLDYLRYLEKILDFPIGYDSPDILKFISESPNKKYITPIESYWLDEGSNELQDFDALYKQDKNDQFE